MFSLFNTSKILKEKFKVLQQNPVKGRYGGQNGAFFTKSGFYAEGPCQNTIFAIGTIMIDIKSRRILLQHGISFVWVK